MKNNSPIRHAGVPLLLPIPQYYFKLLVALRILERVPVISFDCVLFSTPVVLDFSCKSLYKYCRAGSF